MDGIAAVVITKCLETSMYENKSKERIMNITLVAVTSFRWSGKNVCHGCIKALAFVCDDAS